MLQLVDLGFKLGCLVHHRLSLYLVKHQLCLQCHFERDAVCKDESGQALTEQF